MQIEWIKLYLSILDHRKIMMLERQFGTNRALGIYIRLILNLTKTPNHYMADNELPIFAELCKMEHPEFVEFLDACSEMGLICHEIGKGFYSPRLMETTGEFDRRSKTNSENAKQYWENIRRKREAERNPEPQPTQEEKPSDKHLQTDAKPGSEQTTIPGVEPAPTPKKEKKNYKAIWERTLAHWNTKDRLPKSSYLPAWENKIRIAIDKFDEPQIIQAINNYADAVNTPGTYYYEHKELWNYYDFMSHQSRGLMAWVEKKISSPVTTGSKHNENRTSKPRFGGQSG